MKHFCKLFFVMAIAMGFMCAQQAVAQIKVNQKFGKPTEEEMAMTTYAADTSAAAVVLYASRTVRYEFAQTDFKTITDVKCRIKVLKEEGKEWANGSVVFDYNNGKYGSCEMLSQLKAYSYNMENGKVVKTKMESSMVSNEDLTKRKRVTKFTVPKVTVGSVIEYEYSISSDFYYTIDDWNAQRSIPVLYTSYELTIPEYFNFNVNETGFHRLEHGRKSVNTTFSLKGGYSASCNCEEYTFVGRDLPALKKENFVYNPLVYGQKVTAELMSIQFPGEPFHSYTTTWKSVDERLMDADGFGDLLKKHVLKDEMAAAGVASLPSVEEKVKAVVKLVSDKVRWNEKVGLTGVSASKALKEGSANNATINFMLINMLNDAGIEAFPVVLRTRDEGFLPVTNPTIDALTTVIVGYSDGEKNHYLDASMLQDGYIDVLPGIMLVDRAHEVRKDGLGDWLNLQDASVAKCTQSVMATLDASGVLSGTSSSRATGIDAAQFRKSFRMASDSTTYVSEKANRHNIEISECNMGNARGFLPVVTETFTFTKQCNSVGDLIYINPLVFPLLDENPFVAEERKVPIDFPTFETQVLIANITLPDGYAVEALPDPISMMSTDKSIKFSMQMGLAENQLAVRCTYSLSKLFFAVDEYLDVKAMFSEIAKQCNNMVVIKKAEQ